MPVVIRYDAVTPMMEQAQSIAAYQRQQDMNNEAARYTQMQTAADTARGQDDYRNAQLALGQQRANTTAGYDAGKLDQFQQRNTDTRNYHNGILDVRGDTNNIVAQRVANDNNNQQANRDQRYDLAGQAIGERYYRDNQTDARTGQKIDLRKTEDATGVDQFSQTMKQRQQEQLARSAQLSQAAAQKRNDIQFTREDSVDAAQEREFHYRVEYAQQARNRALRDGDKLSADAAAGDAQKNQDAIDQIQQKRIQRVRQSQAPSPAQANPQPQAPPDPRLANPGGISLNPLPMDVANHIYQKTRDPNLATQVAIQMGYDPNQPIA